MPFSCHCAILLEEAQAAKGNLLVWCPAAVVLGSVLSDCCSERFLTSISPMYFSGCKEVCQREEIDGSQWRSGQYSLP